MLLPNFVRHFGYHIELYDVERYYLCENIQKLYTFVSRLEDRDFRLLGLVRIFQCPHVSNRWIVTHLSAYLARRARSKVIA